MGNADLETEMRVLGSSPRAFACACLEAARMFENAFWFPGLRGGPSRAGRQRYLA